MFTKFCKHLINNGNTKDYINLLNNSENEYSKFATKNGRSSTVNHKVTTQTKIQ